MFEKAFDLPEHESKKVLADIDLAKYFILLEDGYNLFKEGDYEKSIVLFEKVFGFNRTREYKKSFNQH